MKNKIALLYLIYLRELAKRKLARVKPTVVGVTASAGKTSLCQAIATVLSARFRVKVSEKANSESGIPLNILSLSPKDYSLLDWLRLGLLAPLKLLTSEERYDIYVAELGIDSPHPPKNMEYLLTIVKPKIGVFLNALAVHTQFFDHLVPANITEPERRRKLINLIAAEKGKLITSLPSDGTAVLNLDDPAVAAFATQTRAKVITVSTSRNADLKGENIATSLTGFSLTVKDGRSQASLSLNQLLDEYYAQTFLCALAVGKACGVPLKVGIRELEQHFKLPAGRMSLLTGVNNSVVLDSSYNASPKTMTSALRLLAKVAPRRRVAVLGDMRELGEISGYEHRQLAAIARQTADLVISVGPQMKTWFTPELKRLGFPTDKIYSFINPYEAADKTREVVRKEDTILVKGSQNSLFLEIVVARLLKNPSDAKFLCRRGPFWEKKRQDLFPKR